MKELVKQILNHKELAALPELLESGGLPALVSGLSAVHRANLAAALAERLEKPLFVVTADDTSAENFARDLQSMLGLPVQTLCMREYSFLPAEAVSRRVEQQRLNALYELAAEERPDSPKPITVASVSSLLQRTLPAEILGRAAFTLKVGDTVPLDDVLEALLRCGYERTEQVEGPGQFSNRGGILDLFSPAEDRPIRMEFWGDDIDSMGVFDISSQRREENVEAVTVLPAAEVLPTLSPGGAETLSRKLEELADRLVRRKNSELSGRLAATARTDAEKVRNGLRMPDLDRWLPLLYPAATGFDYIPAGSLVFVDQPTRCAEMARDYRKQLGEDLRLLQKDGLCPFGAEQFCFPPEEIWNELERFPVFAADAFTLGRGGFRPGTLLSIAAKQLPSYAGNAQAAAEDLKVYRKQGYRVVLLAGDERRAKVLQSYLREHEVPVLIRPEMEKLPDYGDCCIGVGALSAGMEYPSLKLAVLTDAQLLRGRSKRKTGSKKLPAGRQRIESYADLSIGDYVVHETHGIGRFDGIIKMAVDGAEKDYIKINYAGTDILYVPATQLDLVSKYTGGGEDRNVRLSKMGGTEWAKTRSRAKGAAKEMARKLIALYAERQRLPGYAFSPDSSWQREFEENFPYTETDDQLRCTAEIKRDMEASVPMDRLLCGDVGFGKTEVAFRAIMKCVLDGKQAAILVPTTILAQQHYQTALQRFFGFPVEIETLSRLGNGGGNSQTLKNLESGKCDLVIGTHRLLSKDVRFKNLGLLVVDEEQRFGVTHKEHIKELSRGVDVLTLSATPIPRTMNMALSGIRDMSTIDEAPEDRIPVQTFVMEHDWSLVTDAIRRELQRGGQIYYLHNRIEDIDRTAYRLSQMLENVSIAVAHGKMDKNELARVMDSVVTGQTQVLVCTTIIETGIDIPNVNTLIVEDADRLGLAQLHQIRGRVGRSARRATAYLTFRRNKVLSEDAEKRLSAIRDFAQFGSGIKIAMRDLEIRGAGNLLGAEQSGHMVDVGYDMYMKLLNEAVLEERGIPVPQRADCSADLAVAASIPDRYIPSSEQRMDIYRRIAMIRTEEEADDLLDELIDRYGDPPPGVNALIQVAILRGVAGNAGITDILQKQGELRFTVKEFNMEKVSELYARPEYKGKLRVEAGSKPCLSLKIKSKKNVIDEAREFALAWGGSAERKEA